MPRLRLVSDEACARAKCSEERLRKLRGEIQENCGRVTSQHALAILSEMPQTKECKDIIVPALCTGMYLEMALCAYKQHDKNALDVMLRAMSGMGCTTELAHMARNANVSEALSLAQSEGWARKMSKYAKLASPRAVQCRACRPPVE